jgi:photosystem II stability/assembly factor-like uncharacterized protein/streptogramin lyase
LEALEPRYAPAVQGGWAVGEFGLIGHTSDGSTWKVQSGGGGFGPYQAVAFTDAQNGWAVGFSDATAGPILHTSNGGTNWTTQTDPSPNNNLYAVAAPDPQDAWAVGANGTILHTADGGATWSTQNSGASADLLGVAFVDSHHGWVVGDDGTIRHTSDGGAIWSVQYQANGDALRSIAFTDSQDGWAVGGGGLILHTADGGTTWSTQNSGTSNTLNSVAFADAQHGIAVGAARTALLTTDGGSTWSAISPLYAGDAFTSVTFPDPERAWIAGNYAVNPTTYDGIMYQTSDGGSTWSTSQTNNNVYFAVTVLTDLPGPFGSPTSYGVGQVATGVATGDFRGDGKTDLVVANGGSNNVSVLLGNGNGTFQAAQNYATGNGPVAVAVGDFTGTGKEDLAVVNNSSNTVSILLGNGDGTFSAGATCTVGQSPTSVTVGDFNRDGILDLAVTSGVIGPGTVTILLGNGDGTFRLGASYSVDTQPQQVVAADLRGDGNLDLITANWGSGSSPGSVSVLLGNGDGTFQSAVNYPAGYGVTSVTAGDFNGDGRPDLAAVNVDNTVSVFLNNGNGTFQNPTAYYVPGAGRYVTAADVNGDGLFDLVVAGDGNNTVCVLDGNGDGTFRRAVSNPSGLGTWELAVGSFTGDGKPDVAVTNYDSNTVSVLLNQVVVPSLHITTPALADAGSPFLVTVTCESQFGAVLPYYTGTVHFTSSSALAGLPADYTFTAADAGSHTFQVTLDTAGFQTITATDSAHGLKVTSPLIYVFPGPAASLSISLSTAAVTAGTALTATVTAQDAYGNVASGYTGTIQFGCTDPLAGPLANYSFTTADQGVHAFPITFKTAGVQSLSVVDTSNPALSGLFVSSVPFSTPTASQGLYGITAGPDGNLWFTEYVSYQIGQIGRITPSGTVTEFAIPSRYSRPLGITAGPDGNLWFTESGTSQIGRITPAGVITEFPTPTSGGYPKAIVAGPDGNLWFTEYTTGLIGRITPAGVITEFTVPTYNSGPFGITAGPDGNLWFTELSGNKIGRITPSGTVTEFTIPTTVGFSNTSDPEGITAGPDGNLWFVENSGNKIGKITPGGAITEFALPVPYSEPGSIITGPDGDLWFTEPGQYVQSGRIGHITPAGVITETLLPQGPAALTVGPDKNLWISEAEFNSQIERMTAGVTVTPAAASQLTFTTPPVAGEGTAFSVTLTARDPNGNVATGYTGKVHFSSSDAKAGLPADYTFTAADAGTHTFAVTLNTLGTQNVTATDTTTGLKVTVNFSVVVGPATHLRVTASATETAGTALDLTVTALDADNQVATGYTGTVTFTGTDPKATYPARYTFTATDKGTHTFKVTLKTAGSQTVTVSGPDLPAGAVSAWRGEGNALDSVGGNNGTLQGGITFAPGEVGQAFHFDGYGQYVSVPYSPSLALNTFTVSAWVNLATTPGGANPYFGILSTRFGGEYTFDVKVEAGKVHGDVGTGSGWINTAVDYNATLAPGSWHLVTYVIDNTAKKFSLYLDGALENTIAFSGTPLLMTPGETLEIGQSFPGEFFNGRIDEVQIYSRALAAAEVQGIFINGSAGEFQANLAHFTVTVNPAAAKTLRVTGLPPSTTAGTAQSFTVTALDAYGNMASGYRGMVHFTSTDPQAVLPADYQFTAADAGTHTFSNDLTFKSAGTQTLTAEDVVMGMITGKEAEKVVAGAATHFVITAPATATAGVAFTITVTAEDAYGNTATSYRGTVQLSSTVPLATLLPKIYAFTATSRGEHSFTVTLWTTGKQTITVEDVGDLSLNGSVTVTV